MNSILPSAPLGAKSSAFFALQPYRARGHFRQRQSRACRLKVLERLEIVSEIPRNGLGKIDRNLCQATVALAKAEEIPGRRQ